MTFARTSSRMRWRPRKRYWTSSGSAGKTARIVPGTVEIRLSVRVSSVDLVGKLSGVVVHDDGPRLGVHLQGKDLLELTLMAGEKMSPCGLHDAPPGFSWPEPVAPS